MIYNLKKNENSTEIERLEEISLTKVNLKEKDLENLIANNIDALIRTDQLMVLMQEREYKEEADILALDENGIIYIFELKRWEGKQENILQVLRYGQKFGRYDYEQLNYYFQRYSKNDSQTLQEAHLEFFELDEPLKKESFNKEQKFIVITNGIDYETWDSIAYWKGKGININAIIYRVYKIDKEIYIDFDPYGPIPDAPRQEKSGIYVVNTNKTYDPEAYKDMVNNRKASAYHDRKYSIKNIKSGDTVCLYHVGDGIIGIGKAKTDFQKQDYKGDNDAEYFVPIEFDYLIDVNQADWKSKAVKASEINNNFKVSYRFRQTVFCLPADYEDFIKEKLNERLNGT